MYTSYLAPKCSSRDVAHLAATAAKAAPFFWRKKKEKEKEKKKKKSLTMQAVVLRYWPHKTIIGVENAV